MKKKKVLLIGWDGADWEHINPLLDAGLMPTLDSFVNEGTIGNLATLHPVLSPMLWNSVATGKFADKHGIHGFIEPDPQWGGARPFSSTSRTTKALWNIFSQNGIRSNVINWWASHPAEKIDGVVTTNLFNGVSFEPGKGWRISPGTIYPEELALEYAKLKFFPHEISQEHILPFIPNAANIDQENDPRLFQFSNDFSDMMTTHSIATAVMENHPWEFMAVYFTGIDHFAHSFMCYHPPKMECISDADFEMYKDVVNGAYRFHDLMLARYLQLAGDDTTVILCSDHGFESGAYRPVATPREPSGPTVWHRQYGILAMKGEGIKKDERIYGASLIDIGPTILQLFGLPIGEDMDGRPLLEAFDQPSEIKTIPSWDEVDGNHGMHPEGTTVRSLKSSEELLKQFIALGYVDDTGKDKEAIAKSAEVESKYNLGRCLIWQSRPDEALKLFEEIMFAEPWETRFIVHAADAYQKCGYHKQAIRLLEEAFDLDTTRNLQATIIYAKSQIAIGEIDKGLNHIELSASRLPKQPKIACEIGDLLLKQRKTEKAEAAYKLALSLHSEFAGAWQGLAQVYLRLGQNQNCVDAAFNAVNLLYRLPKSHFCLGAALARSGDYERAVVAFKTVVKFAPNFRHAHRWLSIVYKQLGDSVSADFHDQKVIFLSVTRTEEKNIENQRRDTLFDLPAIVSEGERSAKEIKERPRPSDAVEKSGKTFVLVSGLPRSGTSLMMQMLDVGGMSVLSDGVREADTDNPKGYFEWEAIKQIGESPELLNDADDAQVIKVVSMLLQKMPKEHDYKVIFMMRPVEEVARSQQKMIDRLGTDGADLELDDLIRGLRNHRNGSDKFLRQAKHMDVLKVNYSDLIDSGQAEVEKLLEFLPDGYIKDPEKLLSVVDSSLYRNRSKTSAS